LAVVANIFGTDWLWVLLVVVVLFGGSQLPRLAKNAGEAMKEFRKAHDEASQASDVAGTAAKPVAPPALAPAPSVTVPQAQVAQTGAEEKITLSRAELDALLADREARAKTSAGGGPAQS
jgi:sec-independent protein translocase protein TatA